MTAPHSAQLDPTFSPPGAGVAGVAPAPETSNARRPGAGGLRAWFAAVIRDVRYPPALYLEYTDRRPAAPSHQSVSAGRLVGAPAPASITHHERTLPC